MRIEREREREKEGDHKLFNKNPGSKSQPFFHLKTFYACQTFPSLLVLLLFLLLTHSLNLSLSKSYLPMSERGRENFFEETIFDEREKRKRREREREKKKEKERERKKEDQKKKVLKVNSHQTNSHSNLQLKFSFVN